MILHIIQRPVLMFKALSEMFVKYRSKYLRPLVWALNQVRPENLEPFGSLIYYPNTNTSTMTREFTSISCSSSAKTWNRFAFFHEVQMEGQFKYRHSLHSQPLSSGSEKMSATKFLILKIINYKIAL